MIHSQPSSVRPLLHAYIDEAGDRGWKPRDPTVPPGTRSGSSRTFLMTAVIVPDGTQSALLRGWQHMAGQVGRAGQDIHWQTVRGLGQRTHIATTIAGLSDVSLITTVICKDLLAAGHGLTDSTRLYNWTLRLTLERISWMAKDAQSDVALTFAHVARFPLNLLNNYLAVLQHGPTRASNIEWGYLRLPPAIASPAQRKMLQLADSAAGAAHEAFEPDLYGNHHPHNLTLLKPRYWRRWPTRPLSVCSVKVGGQPTSVATAYPWLHGFCA